MNGNGNWAKKLLSLPLLMIMSTTPIAIMMIMMHTPIITMETKAKQLILSQRLIAQ